MTLISKIRETGHGLTIKPSRLFISMWWMYGIVKKSAHLDLFWTADGVIDNMEFLGSKK